MNVLNQEDAFKVIEELSQLDLEKADYEYIKKQIDRLFQGNTFKAITIRDNVGLYRGVKYDEKPKTVDRLGYPPSDLVKSFQRCNPPNKPLFYCSPDPVSVFYELNCKSGDLVYLSRWIINRPFFVLQLAPREDVTRHDPTQAEIITFLERIFGQRIHEACSSKYKITAAIAEQMAFGNLENSPTGAALGGMTYPSVAHPSKSENVAIRPDIVDACLKLEYVEQVRVIDAQDQGFEIKRTDFAALFTGGKIGWINKPPQWTIQPGAAVMMRQDPNGWVPRNLDGTILMPD